MSQPVVEFSRPTPADVDELVANMRAQDVAEVYATGCTDLRAAVEDGIAISVMCWTCRVDGEMAAIFGCAPGGSLLDPCGVPWLLGTDLIPPHRRILARPARHYIAQMLAAFPHLSNAVHAENTVAVRWLRKMGFVLAPAVPAATGAMFHSFMMSR